MAHHHRMGGVAAKRYACQPGETAAVGNSNANLGTVARYIRRQAIAARTLSGASTQPPSVPTPIRPATDLACYIC